MHTLFTPQGWPKRTTSSWICSASSRVGASTSASGPSPSASTGCAFTCTTAGSRKASVLPDPVSASPMKSAPFIAIGHACR